MPRTGQLAQLKVTLRGARPPIWRRCLVPTDATLAELHRVLQIAMGWLDGHLHQFRRGSTYYGVPDPEFPPGREDERRVRVSQVLRSPKDKMIYEYDFGDGWEHEVVLEKLGQSETGQRYPRVIAGKRACPPEDCGGVGGYDHLLEVLANPKHPEHGELMEWCGGEIDPDFFDLEDTNEAMAIEFGRGRQRA